MVLGFVFIGGKRTICEFDNLPLRSFRVLFHHISQGQSCCLEAVVAE